MKGNRPAPDVLATPYGVAAFTVLVVAVFFALRLSLLFVRDPFYDELFTSWITRKSFGGILQALRSDSGPPLYYFVAHALGLKSVLAFRLLSLACATITILLVAIPRRMGNAHLVGASLLTVYAPAALFAVDGRAYAMAAMFVAAGLVALERRRLLFSAVLFVLGGYTHYYGVLFFPLLLLPLEKVTYESGAKWLRIRSSALALLLFAPGLWLAAHQPRAAMGWLHANPLLSFTGLSFAARYPKSLFHTSPQALTGLALLVLAGALIVPVLRDRETRRDVRLFAAATLLPLVLAAAAGVYFPMRFESVIAVPLALWVGTSVERSAEWARRAVILLLVVIGLAVNARGIVDHAERPRDDYRAAALWVGRNVPRSERVVAAGYLYLETIENGRPDAVAFPRDQALHPGWRALSDRNARPPAGPFVWIGERGTPEQAAALGGRRVQPLFVNRRAMVARVQ